MKCFISSKQIFTNIMKKLNEVDAWSLTINLLIKQNTNNWTDAMKNVISLLSYF